MIYLLLLVATLIVTVIFCYLYFCNETNSWLNWWEFVSYLRDDWINTQMYAFSLSLLIFVNTGLGLLLGLWIRAAIQL